VVSAECFKNLVKKITNTFLICSLILTPVHFSHATNPEEPNTAEDRVHFERALNPEAVQEAGIDPNQVVAIHTQAANQDKAPINIDLIQVMTSSPKALATFKLFESEIRRIHEKNPDEKFKFLYLPDGTLADPQSELSAEEMVRILNSIDDNSTEVIKPNVNPGLLARYKQKMGSMFDKTTKSDWVYGILRWTVNGVATTYVYHMNYPLPVSMIMGLAITGTISASFGIFIEKYIGWLTDNEARPNESKLSRFKNYVYSPETLLFMSPFLIGIQDHNLINALNISAVAGATVVVQNAYRYLKQKSPQAAFMYKWYSTEAFFATMPFVILPAWGIYANGEIFSTVGNSIILATFYTAAIAMASQGLSDKVTEYIREPFLKAGILKDDNLFMKKFGETNVFALDYKSKKSIFHEFEFTARQKFKPYFFGASIVSVASAMTTQLGNNNSNSTLTNIGFSGLATLGLTSLTIWLLYKFGPKNWSWHKTPAYLQVKPEDLSTPPVCSMLFAG